jgi:hypothetical protein
MIIAKKLVRSNKRTIPPPILRSVPPLIPYIPSQIINRPTPRRNFAQVIFPKIEYSQPLPFEIFAYCSKNYEDAYNFVINSWIKLPNVTKITIYTDWKLIPTNDKVIVNHMFDCDNSWIVGTGRRLDVIKHFSEQNKGQKKNILFLDIDCYMVKDVSEVFTKDFDIAISRLYTSQAYTNQTATAGLWFAKLTPGYYNFIEDWFKTAKEMKDKGIGLKDHKISYVQYSFTRVAKTKTSRYNVMAIDEKIYNSEHSKDKLWYELIKKYHPKILHFKGRRFRLTHIVNNVLSLVSI